LDICTSEGFRRDHYRNGLLIKRDQVFTNLLKQFLDFEETYFKSFKNESYNDVKNHLDTFKMFDPAAGFFYDYIRFNAVRNRSVKLFKATSIEDRFQISLNNFYKEEISDIEYYLYSFLNHDFYVYVGDNSLNSFGNLQYLWLDRDSKYYVYIEKVSIETKLPEPYNRCKKSSVDEPYHQSDCIKACTYKEIQNKYNCTFQETLFSVQGFRQCVLNYKALKDEFSASCMKKCPLESCFSEKITFDYATIASDLDFTRLRFYLRDLSSLNITQIPKTDPFTFLNNIGGGLGLFMGIAFPNLIEFFQFILEIVLIIFIRKIN